MSAETDAIDTEIAECTVKMQAAADAGNSIEYLHYVDDIATLTLVNAALKDLDTRLAALEP